MKKKKNIGPIGSFLRKKGMRVKTGLSLTRIGSASRSLWLRASDQVSPWEEARKNASGVGGREPAARELRGELSAAGAISPRPRARRWSNLWCDRSESTAITHSGSLPSLIVFPSPLYFKIEFPQLISSDYTLLHHGFFSSFLDCPGAGYAHRNLSEDSSSQSN